MNIELKTARWLATVETKGAELRRLYCTKRKEEILWTGDPTWWKGTAPILFPVIGRLKGGRYSWQGKTYPMEKHGFARFCEFEVVRQSDAEATFRLQENDYTRGMYPFRFRLEVTYRLEDAGLAIRYDVTNTGEEILPFTIGSHPGFMLPGELEGYRLVFDEPETLDVYQILPELDLLQNEGRPYLNNETTIPLTKALFKDDALIFKNIKSKRIHIDGPDGRRLTVETGGEPHLGIWAKPGAPYVCIEPWYGHDESPSHDGTFEHKPGFRFLKPNEAFSTSMRFL